MRLDTKYKIIIGWALYSALLFTLTLTASDLTNTTVRVSAIILPQALFFYLNYLYLAPNYLENDKKRTYFVVIAGLLLAGAYLGGELDNILSEYFPFRPDKEAHHGRHFMRYVARFFMGLMPVVISTLLVKSILLSQKNKESLELKNKMLEAETKALKAQINPHFLFNTLNNIYSLSQLNPEKTGGAILQLSDILRYVTYDGNQKEVPLSGELEHIKSFIQLQLLKDENASNISIDIDVNNEQLKISPLLLIPFIENCFKHGNHHDKANGWIKISIKNEGNQLILETANSTPNETSKKDKIGGIGMENVKRRLALLYPDAHELIIKIDKFSYASTLKINLAQ